MCSMAIYFIGLWGTTAAVDTIHFDEDVSLKGWRFTTNITFDYHTNKLRCANKCLNQASCKSWIFSGTHCTGYDTIFKDTSLGNCVLSSATRYYFNQERVTQTDTVDDCSQLNSMGSPSGIYTIYPENVPNGVTVYCDMDTDGGGWIVIQNRYDGSVDFYRTWDEYRFGFGNLNTEFWLGNDYIHLITKSSKYLLRFDLGDAHDNERFAVYNNFIINDETDKYRLTVSDYSGDLGDSSGFTYNNNAVFSTKDQDATSSCTSGRQGAWWYKGCTWVNLNGPWVPGTNSWASMMWNSWKSQEGMKKTSMKLRRK